ncbi:unnamed protein product [Protopolystoma xenopodis]|uniref:Peptidase M3A/M3B catalytic domain-containing protein n=1 Tax=Protopolystoma xenopodis TaxID=117903 RepID=A0A3S5A363_9PLAT|nr:unnamed protein product [Protopolystoma xenopodis]
MSWEGLLSAFHEFGHVFYRLAYSGECNHGDHGNRFHLPLTLKQGALPVFHEVAGEALMLGSLTPISMQVVEAIVSVSGQNTLSRKNFPLAG